MKQSDLVLGDLYWIILSDFNPDPFSMHKFLAMHTEYGEDDKPLFLGQYGLKHYGLVFKTEAEADAIIEMNERTNKASKDLNEQIDKLKQLSSNFYQPITIQFIPTKPVKYVSIGHMHNYTCEWKADINK